MMKINMNDFLKSEATSVPAWLMEADSNYSFNFQDFFSSRTVYYPGAEFDGQPLKLFGSNHVAHCFIYVDYMIGKKEVAEQLSNIETRFRGYNTLLRIDVKESELTPSGWKRHVEPRWDSGPLYYPEGFQPFAMLEILEREGSLDDNHGPSRLAVLFIGGDGIATYDALFCQNNGVEAPYALIVVDHVYGGNYCSFGRDGRLEEIARKCHAFPKWLLLAIRGSFPWDGYEKVDTENSCGGMHGTSSIRFLYRRSVL